MNETAKKELTIPYRPELDEKGLEAVSDFLEQEVEKHTIECRNWPANYAYHPITAFAIAYTKRYIYVDFYVIANYLRAVNYKNNTPVAEDSCVEFFMKLADGKEYWNFEFNCIGTINASHREVRENKTPLTDEEIARIKVYASCGTRPFEEMEGLFTWNLIVAIPLELVGLDGEKMPDYILGNFYKCGSKTSMPHLLSWSPIDCPKPDFHRPEYFGKLILEKRD